MKEYDDLIEREMAAGACANEGEREAIAGIRAALEDVAAGRTMPFDEFDRNFRERKGIGTRS